MKKKWIALAALAASFALLTGCGSDTASAKSASAASAAVSAAGQCHFRILFNPKQLCQKFSVLSGIFLLKNHPHHSGQPCHSCQTLR